MSKTAAQLLAEANAQIETIWPKDAADEAAAGKAVFLDVREPVEWEHHVPGALQIPRGTLEWFADPTSSAARPGRTDPARRVIGYCWERRAGGALATATLKTLGFT